MYIEEVLIVQHNGNLFGIDTSAIEHLLRVLDITPIPLAPKSVRGLCAIEGSIMTVLDLSLLLLGDTKIDASQPDARLITINSGEKRFTVLTEKVINNIIIDQNNVEYLNEEDRRSDGVVAAYKYNDEIMQLLDLNTLVDEIKIQSFETRAINDKFIGSDSDDDSLLETFRRYLLFTMGEEKYGVEVNRIREIIALPESFTDIADAGEEIVGMITLREELIVIADLRKIYNISGTDGDKNRIIIVQHKDRFIGVLIDSIVDIADFSKTEVDKLPSNFKDDKLSGVVHLDGDLVSIINLGVIEKLIERESRMDSNSSSAKGEGLTNAESTIEVVSFTLDNKSYAFHTEEVIEIIDNFDITTIPDMPEMVIGVTNIRGQVLPVISLYKKLELREEILPTRRMIVCQLKDNAIGVIVDSVIDVSNIPKDLFLPENESPYFSHIIKTDDKNVILMIDIKHLFENSVGNK